MTFPQTFLDRLKTHDGIPDLLARELDAWKRNGSGYTARVPWRPDEHPSLSVFRRDDCWFFKDHALGDSGDVLGLVQRVQACTFPEAVTWLAERLGERVPEDAPRREKVELAPVELRLDALGKLYAKAAPLDDGTEAAEYLRGRGLLDAARALPVRGFPPGEPAHLADKRLAARLGLLGLRAWVTARRAFLVYATPIDGTPIIHRARLLCRQKDAQAAGFRSTHWTPPTTGGLALPSMWPTLPDELANGAEIIPTEGETDALAVRTLVPGAQAFAILGASRFGPQAAEFKRLVAARARVTLAFQADGASRKNARRLCAGFKQKGLDVTALQPSGGAFDWAEALAFGADEAESLSEIGAPLDDHSLGRAFHALGQYTQDLKAGRITALATPWHTLNWSLGGKGIPPKSLGLLASKTGIGKSWLALQLALRVSGADHSESQGDGVFIVNTELHNEAVAARMLALKAENSAIASMTHPDEIEAAAFDWQRVLDKLPLEVTDPEPRSLDEVLDMLREKARTKKLLIVDHIGDLDCGNRAPYAALPDFGRAVRKIAKTGAAVLLVTHLRSGEEGDVTAFSRQIENVADFSWSLQGLEPRTAVCAGPCGNWDREINRTLTVRKNRFGPSDVRIGMVLDGETLALRDMGRFVRWAKGGAE